MSSPPAPAPPRLRRFELLEELGRGTTGTTWLARARVALGGLAPGDRVALKLLHPELVRDKARRDAFLREARAGMAVRHPNLVRTFAVEEVRRSEGRLLYIVLEYLAGRSLRDWLLHDGVAGEPTLRSLARQIAGALAALHENGLLHLDVKPENLLWDTDRAVLMDLGFARAPAAATGAFLGTPAYAAPELLRGAAPSAAADLFALGVTLFETATSQRPFGDERRQGLFEARRTAVLRRPSALQPRLSPFFDALVLALLAEDPAARLGSARELEQILDEGEDGAWWREQAEPVPSLPVVHFEALPFVGRDAELAALEASFAAARHERRPRLVDVVGAAGCGKSRLVLELAASWRKRPEAPPLLYGRCPWIGRLGGGSALRPMRDALARSLGLVPGQEPGPAVERRLRAALDPDSALTLIELLRGRPYPREKRRRAFRAWLRALGAEGPFLLFLDDVEHAAPHLWEFLAEVLAGDEVPALILLAHRPELETRAAAGRRRLLEQPRAQALELGPLTRAEVARLLHSLFAAGALDAGLEEALAAGSAGAPGALESLLRLLRRRGELVGSRGELRPARAGVVVPPTAGQEQLLLQELREMGWERRTLLQWASLFAPPLSVRALARCAKLSESRVARGLAVLQRDGWLKVEDGRYRFTLPSERAAAYRSLEAAEAERRHAHAFAVLVELRHPLASNPAQLAFHAHRGGLHQEALALGLPLVERALKHGAALRAARALESLAEHRDALEQPPAAALECRLLVARARVAGQQGDHKLEAELLSQAGAIAAAAGDARLRSAVHLGLARHARAMGFEGAARIHAERARALLAGP